MIHLHEVKKIVGSRELFSNLTLFLPKASYTLLSGERQSGKTTLLRILMAYEKPDQGTITVDGIDLGSITENRIPYLRRQIGLIGETPVLLEDRTVAENISVPLQLAGFDQDITDQRMQAMLELTGLLDDKNKKVNRLKAATRQLVSAARATIHKPPIILADEPDHLNDETTDLIVTLLNNANTAGATVLVTCQNNYNSSLFNGRVSAMAKTLTLKAGSIADDEHSKFNQEPVG